MLPRQFFLMQKAHHKKVQQKTQESWEQTRWIAAVLLQPHMKKGKRMKPTDLVKFPWEEKPKTKQTKKEIQHEIDYTLQLYNKINHGKKKD